MLAAGCTSSSASGPASTATPIATAEAVDVRTCYADWLDPTREPYRDVGLTDADRAAADRLVELAAADPDYGGVSGTASGDVMTLRFATRDAARDETFLEGSGAIRFEVELVAYRESELWELAGTLGPELLDRDLGVAGLSTINNAVAIELYDLDTLDQVVALLDPPLDRFCIHEGEIGHTTF